MHNKQEGYYTVYQIYVIYVCERKGSWRIRGTSTTSLPPIPGDTVQFRLLPVNLVAVVGVLWSRTTSVQPLQLPQSPALVLGLQFIPGLLLFLLLEQ